ncbi:MAG: WbqC family protein [Flavobacteriales bacterium]
MTIAIMQPYLFPYIGYYQLAQIVDRFVVYDEVNYIKQGWVNRNNILVNGAPSLFTLPLSNPSSNALIKDLVVDARQYPIWRKKFLKTLSQVYSKAPQYATTVDLVNDVLEPDVVSIAELATRSITLLVEFFGMDTVVIPTATHYGNANLNGQDRILDICKKEGATRYINAQGGRTLYDHPTFASHGIDLAFLKPSLATYEQGRYSFVPGLSIIDVLMFNSFEQVREMLRSSELTK